MGGEHELDAHRPERVGERRGCHPGGEKPGEDLGRRPALRCALFLTRVVAAPPFAMVLLGNIGEGQEVRERPRHCQRVGDRHLAQDTGERLDVEVRRARLFGGLAHLLDPREQRLTLVLPQHPAEQLPQQPYVVSKRLVRIGGHEENPG